MDVTLTQESPILLRAQVKVPWDKVADHYKAAVKEVGKSVQVPGFRKGKAPAAIIKKRFKDYILSEVAQKVVPESFDSWMKEKAPRAVGQPRLENMDLNVNDNLEYLALVDIRPEIEVKDWKGVEAEKLNVTLEDGAVDTALEQRIQAATKTENITDRAAEKGDLVSISIDAVDAADGSELTALENYELKLDDDADAILSEMVIGSSEGDSIEDELEIGDTAPFDEWKGKTVKIYVDLKAIKSVSTPELNDDFAKDQDFEDLEDMKKKVGEELLEQAQEQEELRFEGSVLTKLLEEYDFDVPESLIRQEAGFIVETQFAPYMQMLGGQDENMQRQMFDQMMQMAYPQAMTKARIDIMVDAIADIEKVEVDADAVDEEIGKYAESQNSTLEEAKKLLEERGSIEIIEQTLKRQKAVKAIVNEAKMILVDELTQPEVEGQDDYVGVESAESDEPEHVEAEIVDESGAKS